MASENKPGGESIRSQPVGSQPGAVELSAAELAAVAQLGLSQSGLPEAMLWDELDLDDPDDRRFGDFELLERIGRGGMGVVFRASQVSLGREVAVKFIVGSLADNPRAIATFFAEARAAARLHHPHIVPVFETGKVDGMHFFSMPLLGGGTLAQRLATGRPTTAGTVDLMLKLCAAVDYAHGFGLLHLDLKPANVLFDEHGQPLIGDFGLARHVDANGGVDAHEVSGTAACMAPEQVDAGAHRLSKRTDVYALGAILYELLTGTSPHGMGDAASQMRAAQSGQVRSPRTSDPSIDKDLDAICLKCLRTNPAERYQSVAELGADLVRLRDGNSVSVREPSWRERLGRSMRRNPRVALATAMVFVALAVGLLTTLWQWQRAEQARVEADRQRGLATLEAHRNRDLAGFMAAAFPRFDPQHQDHSDSARDAVAWLKKHASNDPAAQRAVLTSFRQALDAAHKGGEIAALMTEIIDQLGDRFREEQVERLARRGDRDSLIAATLIGIPRDDQDSSNAHEAVMQSLFDEHPHDQLALYAVALACNVQPHPCRHPEYYSRLTAEFPANAVNWVLVPAGPEPGGLEIADHLLHAAHAQAFDDQLPALTTLVHDALRDQPVPESILQPMQAVVGESDVAPSLRRDAVGAVAVPSYGKWMYACKPGSPEMSAVTGLRDACGKVAINGMRSEKASVVARMVTGSMVRRLFKGTPLETEGRELRRQYCWLSVYMSDVPAQAEEKQRDIELYGDWEAMERQAERAGVSRFPPPGWVPADPQTLLLSEERAPPNPQQ
ncbi:MAG TPA: serine/threonine-protein kinase [Xanthomonadaceae bacterium]|jgi:hypothetical protein